MTVSENVKYIRMKRAISTSEFSCGTLRYFQSCNSQVKIGLRGPSEPDTAMLVNGTCAAHPRKWVTGVCLAMAGRGHTCSFEDM